MGWVAALQTHLVSCDTAPMIYYIETNPTYIPLVDPFFDALDRGEFRIVTSTITLLEVLVHPFRKGDTALAHKYETLLRNTSGVQLMSISPTVARAAAQIRAVHNLRTPDALQIATAIEQGATFFVTNDPIFKRVPGIEIIVLDELSPSAGAQSLTP